MPPTRAETEILPAMLEQETQIIIHTLTERAIGSAQSLALKDALTADLPKSIKLYLQCEVTRWLQNDLRNANHFSNVRSATPSVHQLIRTFMRALASEYVFTREEFSGTLENAVHFVENYLCRPQWTLEQFVFEKSESVTNLELRNKFEYLSDYLYYGKLIQSYMQQKGRQEIGVGEFRSLLSKFDEQVVKQHTPRELVQLTRPIFEYLLLQRELEGKPIPIKPLIVFFEDKKMWTLKEYIERICHIRNTKEVTIDGLGEIIEDLYGGTSGLRQPPSHESSPSSNEVQQANRTSTAIPVEQPSRHVEQQQQLPFPQIQEQETKPSDPPVEQASRQIESRQGTDRRNIALSLTFSGMAEAAQSSGSPSPRQDFLTAISEEQRERFIKAVFQRDEAYYDVVMESLNAMTTWRDASLYLQTFYQATGVDPYSQDVIEFTDLIQNRYASTEHP